MAIKGKDIGIAPLQIAEAWHHHETYQQRWHRHGGLLEIHCVFSGAICYEFESGASATIPGGAYLVIPSNVRHRAVIGEGTPAVRLDARWRISPQTWDLTSSPVDGKELAELLDQCVQSPLVVRRMPPRLHRAARDLFNVVDRHDTSLLGRLAAWTFLAEVANTARHHSPVSSTAEDIAKKICAFMRTHCTDHLQMRDLVRFSGYSRRRLFSIIREQTGLSPGRYLMRCRIDAARRMMVETPSRPLVDIALACGFSSASHFSSVFGTYTGETPRTYRKEGRVGL